MNVCLISREFPPFYGGGIGTYTERHAWALARAGHGVVVVTVSRDGTAVWDERHEVGGFRVVRLPFVDGDDWSGPHAAIATDENRRAWRELHPVAVLGMEVARAMPRVIEEFGVEAIEAPDVGGLARFVQLGMSRGRIPRRPVTTMVHGPSAWVASLNRESLRPSAMRALCRLECAQARASDSVVCPSIAVSRWAERCWGLRRGEIATVPLALGPMELVARAAADGGGAVEVSREGVLRVLFVGRLEPRKGVDTLVAAAGIAIRDGVALRLDLAGEDMPHPDHAGRRFGGFAVRLLPETAQRSVRLLGKVDAAGLMTLRARADVCVVPSPMDNFPIVCMEAMASGRTVIAAGSGGMAEMIEDGRSGVLFAPGDASGCARAIERVAAMGRAGRDAMGREAARRILRMCSNEGVVARRVELYGAARRQDAVS